uniref:Tektin n=1 Tax=Spermophilus dauricus TaxID=99837 RepID=A0A8C9URB9_SPEDA
MPSHEGPPQPSSAFRAPPPAPVRPQKQAFTSHSLSWVSFPVGFLPAQSPQLLELCSPPSTHSCASAHRLVSEVEELHMSLDALREKLQEAEQALRNLEDTRLSMEKDIAIKTNSLFIDRQKCMAHRARYPSILQLAGYQ